MPRSGTLVICVQNLDFSGANQVVLNIVAGRMHESNVVVLSPKVGKFAARFVESGAAVRVGVLEDLLNEIRDVFCIICNTIMTANIVVEMSQRPHPVIWILHEWWDDEMIKENLRIRNYQGLNLNTVKQAMAVAAMVVCVCESQRQLYGPTAPSTVTFVGVPDPIPRQTASLLDFTPDEAATDMFRDVANPNKPFTFLCLGIICPRKNQIWTAQLFQKFAKNKANVRLQIVGARYTRVYEMEYLQKLREVVGDDHRIEILDVTENVDQYYKNADCLILTSLNEVTPMVIPESLSWGIPVLSTNIAGIKEMYTDGIEGYHFDPDDETKALFGMEQIYSDDKLRQQMSKLARQRFETCFDLDLMVESYRQLVLSVAPPVILLDMDGALIDFDGAFMKQWKNRCPLDRTKSYYIQDCVSKEYKEESEKIFHEKGFFENLLPMPGAIEAVREMEQCGLKVYICTTPILTSMYCAQEKLNWVKRYLGEQWLERVILCHDKSLVAGDLLIDDKPYEYLSPGGKHTTATWKQIIFDAPYNRQKRLPRMFHWKDWRYFIYTMLGKACNNEQHPLCALPPSSPIVYPMVPSFATSNLPSQATTSRENNLEEKVQLPSAPREERPVRTSPQKGVNEGRGGEYKGSLEPFRRQFHITIPGKAKRDSSYGSVHSNMSAEDVQKQHDMLHMSDEPLSAEDIATIVSGSLSLVNGGESSDEEEEQLRHYTAGGGGGNVASSNTILPIVATTTTTTTTSHRVNNYSDTLSESGSSVTSTTFLIFAEKKKQLQEKLQEKNAEYCKTKAKTEQTLAHESDELDGVQVFRNSYQLWKSQGHKGRSTVSSPICISKSAFSSTSGSATGTGLTTAATNSSVPSN